ncbi:MAG: DUF805 domain-containing protein [Caulobacter sp.]|nr:DUF805 domain-containing protein [Caulobacter sp.]
MLNFFSPQGRIGRGPYALGMLIVLLLLGLTLFVPTLGWLNVVPVGGREPLWSPRPGLIGAVPLLWPLACLQLNRLRDMGASGWWALAPVAVLAAAVTFVQMTDGVNGLLLGWIRGDEALRSQMFWAFPGSHLALIWATVLLIGGIGWLSLVPSRPA